MILLSFIGQMESGDPGFYIVYHAISYGFKKSRWLAPASTCGLLQHMGRYWPLA